MFLSPLSVSSNDQGNRYKALVDVNTLDKIGSECTTLKINNRLSISAPRTIFTPELLPAASVLRLKYLFLEKFRKFKLPTRLKIKNVLL